MSSDSPEKFGDSIQNWQLRRCENPWKPNVHNGQNEVLRRMLGILNRVTQQSVPILLHQVLELPLSHEDQLKSILSLLLSKSQDEPLFTSTYALLCAELAQKIELGPPLSQACHSHFLDSLESLLQYGKDIQEQAAPHLIEEEILARKRLTIHISFVCALERKGLIQVHQLVSMGGVLLEMGDLRSIELLCRLLTFSGSKLSSTQQDFIERCFSTIHHHLSNRDLAPRLKYLLQDTVELRNNGWAPRIRHHVDIPVNRNVRG